MHSEAETDFEAFQGIAFRALKALFRVEGIEAREADESGAVTDDGLAALVYLVGPRIHGSLCLLAAPPTILAARLPRHDDDGGVDPADWIGELANQVAGRLKNRCLSRGLQFDIGVPTVLASSEARILTGLTGQAITRTFATAEGPVELSLDVTLDDSGPLFTDERGGVVAEGEHLLFGGAEDESEGDAA